MYVYIYKCIPAIRFAEMLQIDEICVNKENETDLAGLLTMDADRVDEIIKLNNVKFRYLCKYMHMYLCIYLFYCICIYVYLKPRINIYICI
jgi:hypothetical protein